MATKKTKIVCTIGPSSWDPTTLKKLIDSGMDVARLNFSHGSHLEKTHQIKSIRKISSELKKPIAIIADLQGPKIRLGEIDGIKEIRKGDQIRLALNPATEEDLPMQFDLSPYVKKGHRIFLNDGLVELVVHSIEGKTVIANSQNSGIVSSHKGVNIPDTRINEGVFTEKDQTDAEFALKQKVDYLALSFIQTPQDMDPAINLIKKLNPQTKVLVKVEKKEAVEHLEQIIEKTDAVMVARGDLAIEMPAAEVPVVQQKMIKLSRQHYKPVIVATQMLESMTENPRPTRAEVSDVANAVLDQVDAVMLSAESASGRYPVESVITMREIIESVESVLDVKHYIKIDWDIVTPEDIAFRALTSAAASIGYRVKAQAIAVATATGRTAYHLSSFRPDSKIIAITHDEQTKNQLALAWGVTAVIVGQTYTADQFWDHTIDEVNKLKFLKKGDKLIVVNGSKVGQTGGTDTIKIATI